jgi:predicted transcriptional regulator
VEHPLSKTNDSQLLTLTAQIVSAHVARNTVAVDALPDLIKQTYQALGSVGDAPTLPEAERPMPAVPLKKSVFPDYIICLEDGKKLKTLKRHLHSSYSMSPEQYRERWGLPRDYPMVAPNYAERRSALAKQIGLGRKAAKPAVANGKAKASRKRAAAAV